MNTISKIVNLSHRVKTSSITLEGLLDDAYDKFFEDIRHYLLNRKIAGFETYSLKTTKLHKHARLFDFSIFKGDSPIIIQLTVDIYPHKSAIQTKIKILVDSPKTELFQDTFDISTLGLTAKIYDKLADMLNL